MNFTFNRLPTRRLAHSALSALLVVAGGASYTPAQAADIEVFFTGPSVDAGTPNVIFILDASSSMWTEVSAATDDYDATDTYVAPGCDPLFTGFYYVVGSGTPSCSSPKVSLANFYCPDTAATLGATRTQLTFSDKLAEFFASTGKNPKTGWRDLSGGTDVPIQCQDDPSPSLPVADTAVNWSKIKTQGVTFYHPNFMAWRSSEGTGGSARRIDVMRDAVMNLAANTDDINIALMRFGANNSLDTTVEASECVAVIPTCSTEGDLECTGQSGEGLVVMAMQDIDGTDTLATIEDKLFTETVPGQGSACDVQLFTPNGRTGMATTLLEAYRYYRGDDTSSKNANGTASIGSQHSYPSVAGSRIGNTLSSGTYQQAVGGGCSKNYIVMLSDGTTEQDNSTDGDIVKLKEPAGTAGRSFANLVGSCDEDPELDSITPTPSQCVDDLAEYMFKADAAGGYGMDGIQNIKTFTIGFALDATAKNNAEPLLRATAVRGGGKYYEANDAQSLKDAFDDLIRSILTDNATFTAPAVTVDAFNRTRNLDDIYVSLFRPELGYRWMGNVKKFRVDDSGDIIDVNGAPAVDPADGFLLSSSQSFWSDLVDGKDITLGGAAAEIPSWNYAGANARKVYSNLTGTSNISLITSGNQLSAVAGYDVALARSTLGLTSSASDLAISATDLVQWLYGRDIADADADSDVDESRRDMGDPLHSRPVVLVYGGTVDDPDIDDAVLFVTTNDGFMHAVNTVDGSELWSFIPEQLLGRTRDLFFNESVDPEDRVYGLDGTPRLLIFDNNNNGIIEPTDADGMRDRALLFFGMRRGGTSYFAMDVSNKTAPKLLWVNSTLPGVGQTWSTPQPARVKTDAGEKLVLFVSGGYSTAHEAGPEETPPAWQQYPNPDTAGNRIYMLDMFNGQRLWHAGPATDSDADLKLADMEHAFAADVRVLELTGDGFADRLYAADLGGRVWRFDIFNGEDPQGTTEGDRLVEGGVLANLGNAGDSTPASIDTRRFYYAPDAVPFELYGRSIVNIGIGSGHRELPATDQNTRNAFFSIRDYNAKTRLLSSQYKASCTGALGPCHQIVTESDADLIDLTNTVGQAATSAVPDGVKGWKVWLSTDYGEKVLAEARTLGGRVFFTTYEPTPGTTYFEESCAFDFGTNRLYVVDIVDARPYYPDEMPFDTDTDGDGVADAYTEQTGDRYTELTQQGIASEVVFLFTDQLVPGTTTGEREVFCLAGFASCPPGLSVEPVRTYWRQRGVQ